LGLELLQLAVLVAVRVAKQTEPLVARVIRLQHPQAKVITVALTFGLLHIIVADVQQDIHLVLAVAVEQVPQVLAGLEARALHGLMVLPEGAVAAVTG
jgi:hypothetical protein